MQKLLLLLVILGLVCACGHHSEPQSVDVLAQMRADTVWIHELDSLAAIAIGSGAKCIDPVWHTFEYDGRTWFFNQDWGGVLEIPSDYIPTDDIIQAELSFHGTCAFSPDSLVCISFYSGYQSLSNADLREMILENLSIDGFVVTEIQDTKTELVIRADDNHGMTRYSRCIYAGEDGVQYSASVVFQEGKNTEADSIIAMIDRFPIGPSGTAFKGSCCF